MKQESERRWRDNKDKHSQSMRTLEEDNGTEKREEERDKKDEKNRIKETKNMEYER